MPAHLATKLWPFLLVLALGACASKPYQGTELSDATFLSRSQTQQLGSLKVTAAVPAMQRENSMPAPLTQCWWELPSLCAGPCYVAVG